MNHPILPNLGKTTCYTAPGASTPFLLPCGNPSLLGHRTACCRPDDLCLPDKSCFAVDKEISYEGGCTDKKLDDFACPCVKEANGPPVGVLTFCPASERTYSRRQDKGRKRRITAEDGKRNVCPQPNPSTDTTLPAIPDEISCPCPPPSTVHPETNIHAPVPPNSVSHHPNHIASSHLLPDGLLNWYPNYTPTPTPATVIYPTTVTQIYYTPTTIPTTTVVPIVAAPAEELIPKSQFNLTVGVLGTLLVLIPILVFFIWIYPVGRMAQRRSPRKPPSGPSPSTTTTAQLRAAENGEMDRRGNNNGVHELESRVRESQEDGAQPRNTRVQTGNLYYQGTAAPGTGRNVTQQQPRDRGEMGSKLRNMAKRLSDDLSGYYNERMGAAVAGRGREAVPGQSRETGQNGGGSIRESWVDIRAGPCVDGMERERQDRAEYFGHGGHAGFGVRCNGTPPAAAGSRSSVGSDETVIARRPSVVSISRPRGPGTPPGHMGR
ncbi:hypothetical protein QBC47DRAFT_397998 [Echria macrotheca]|uniref:Uncharacterized protein n=1 Tax=Echria macrotheca TaxID=438768 RepID=A0AAJ0BL35_9PEZI|nr:hypothetical protein QBC47DRAFT_397998 [Echria macrotheca]